MRYAKRLPSIDEGLRKAMMSEGWRRIKEPSNLFTALLYSLPFVLFNSVLSFMVIALFDKGMSSDILALLSSGTWTFTIRFDYVLYAYLLILFHEVLHLVLIPDFISSKNTWFGIKPWGGFVFTTEKLSKRRFIMISLGPFLALSLILPVVLALLGIFGGFLAFLVLLNAAASSVDTLNAFLILSQVPKHATIINNGFESYYKVEGEHR